MKFKRVRWGAMEVLLAAMLLIFIFGYVKNVYELSKLDSKTAEWPELTVRVIGVVVPPVGILIGLRSGRGT